MHFSTFTRVRQTCFAYNFFGVFGAIFYVFEISMKFWYLFYFLQKKIVGNFSTFSNCEAKRAKNGAKNQKNVLRKCVLDLNCAPNKRSVFLIF
jgi:hypothetical protein